MTIAALFAALVVVSAIALQNLFVPDTANEDAAEATEEITQAPKTTDETTALEETTHLEETTALKGPQATSEEARCDGTRTVKIRFTAMKTTYYRVYTTNDVPGCPYGGLLSGTDGRDNLAGKDGDDEIHGLGSVDAISGGGGNDGIYGGPGDDGTLSGDRGDDVIYEGAGDEGQLAGAAGEDVLYGGNGNDSLDGLDHSIGLPVGPTVRDELYCGPGKDKYAADRLDYVDSSCEEKVKEIFGGGGIA